VAGRKGESDGIKETGGARLPPGMARWGGRGAKRRGRRGGGFKGHERKGQSNPGGNALRRLWVLWWWWHWRYHRVKIRPWLAVDGRVTDHGVILFGGAEVHRGHVDEVRLGMRAVVECRGAGPTHRIAALVIVIKAADPHFKRGRCRVGGFRNRHGT
jgi:hypothetical protein